MRSSERTLLNAYRDLGTRARVHTGLRWRTAPLDAVEQMVPHVGDVLDFGSGHGLLALRLAQRSTERRVLGVDPDPEKIRLARAAADVFGMTDRVRFESIDEHWSPPEATFDAVVLVDVLYLFPAAGVARVLAGAGAALRPDGRLIVKEMADRPRWKRAVTTAQEHLTVRALGLTHGEVIRLPTEDEIRSAMESQGLEVRRVDLARRSLHPHLAFTGRRPVRRPSIASPPS